MANVEVKSDRRYTKDHEGAKGDAKEVVVGVSAYAVEQLGDITLVNIDVKAGDEVKVGKSFGTVESVKTLADLFAPLSGKVLRVNESLMDAPEQINQDCYAGGWLIAIQPAAVTEYEKLLDPKAYSELIAAGH
jgi:glycine cleavage system H protein